MMGQQKLAIYLRLSMEDRIEKGNGKGLKDESNSISNQRKMIQDFIRNKPELTDYENMEFCDDGYSGTSMERPGMKKLLEEIKNNHIGCIIVKDMSRFSRDYIELGTYLNQIFPFMRIRFISINDHYDSKEHEGSTIAIDTAFQTLLYDLYSKDISIKMKAAVRSKCENGEYVFGQVPLGYEKSKEVKNTVIINEREAEIVRYIFSLAADGKGSTQIAKQLYAEGIPTTMELRYPDRVEKHKHQTWDGVKVRRILNNRFYLGEMTYGKSVRERVGSKKGIAVPKQDWKVVANHHEPLITPEIFALVSSFCPERIVKKNQKKHPLVGKIFCGGCGYSLNYKSQSKSTKYAHFWCRKHAILQIQSCCTYFNISILEETILLNLCKELMKRGNVEKQGKNLEQFQKAWLEACKRKWEENQTQLRKMTLERNGLYESYRLNEYTAEEYRCITDELDKEILSLEKRIQETKEQYNQAEEAYRQKKEDMKQIIRYLHIEELTQEVVDVFIKKIYVYRDKRVEIEWDFAKDE